MAEFNIIETQEQLDAIISERLKRDREVQAKKYEGWFSPDDHQKALNELSTQIKTLEDAASESQKVLAEKDAEIAKGAQYRTDLEKTRIALAAGLKIEYADRLRGETADEWKQDAEALAKDFATAHITAPLGDPEPQNTGTPSTRDKFAEWMNEKLNN